jgi:hypothetical protein
MKTVTYQGEDFYVVPAPVPEHCHGCRFEHDACNHMRSIHQCFEEWEDKPAEDRIFIPATDEALAKWVDWRMNGYPEAKEAYAQYMHKAVLHKFGNANNDDD